jgi:hypothetical protein
MSASVAIFVGSFAAAAAGDTIFSMPDVDLLVLNTINAPRRVAVGVEELLACLRGERADTGRVLEAFFDEVPVEAMARFAAAHGLTKATLRGAIGRVRPAGLHGPSDVDDWLRDVAPAAR